MSVSKVNIINKTLTDADTEYSQALSSFCREFYIKSRDPGADIKMSFVSGASGTTYWTIFGGSGDDNEGPFPGAQTIYLQSPTAGTVVEIIEFI